MGGPRSRDGRRRLEAEQIEEDVERQETNSDHHEHRDEKAAEIRHCSFPRGVPSEPLYGTGNPKPSRSRDGDVLAKETATGGAEPIFKASLASEDVSLERQEGVLPRVPVESHFFNFWIRPSAFQSILKCSRSIVSL